MPNQKKYPKIQKIFLGLGCAISIKEPYPLLITAMQSRHVDCDPALIRFLRIPFPHNFRKRNPIFLEASYYFLLSHSIIVVPIIVVQEEVLDWAELYHSAYQNGLVEIYSGNEERIANR
ncbi:hypothetical protein ACJX0J_020625 [Zea mays]